MTIQFLYIYTIHQLYIYILYIDTTMPLDLLNHVNLYCIVMTKHSIDRKYYTYISYVRVSRYRYSLLCIYIYIYTMHIYIYIYYTGCSKYILAPCTVYTIERIYLYTLHIDLYTFTFICMYTIDTVYVYRHIIALNIATSI